MRSIAPKAAAYTAVPPHAGFFRRRRIAVSRLEHRKGREIPERPVPATWRRAFPRTAPGAKSPPNGWFVTSSAFAADGTKLRSILPSPPGHREAGADGQSGAVMVEFAFGLMFLFLLFTAYIKISEIFLAHERLRYATSVAARAHAVGGSASRAASTIDKGYTLSIKKKGGDAQIVSLSKTIDLPEAVGKLFGEKDGFAISHAVKAFMEPSPSGDNGGR